MTASLGLALALACAATAAAAPVPPPADGLVAGRLAIFEGETLVPLRRVEAVLRQPVALALRRGRLLYDARPDADGFFVFRAPAGRYRMEYLSIGGRAEFFPPQEVTVRPGALVCAGTLSFSVYRVEMLGDNSASRLAAADDCAQLLPRIRQLTGWAGKGLSRIPTEIAPEQAPRVTTLPDLLVGLRGEAAFNGTELALRGWYVYALSQGIGEPGAVTVHVSGARLTSGAPGFGVELSGGLGINLFGVMELIGAGGARVGVNGFPTAAFAAVITRAGFAGAGFDLRAQWTAEGPTLFVGVDVAPLFVVGSFL